MGVNRCNEAPSPVLAFDLGGTRIKAGLVHTSTISELRVIAVDESRGAESVISQLVELGKHYLASETVKTIGLSVRGIVDWQAGAILDLGGPLSCLVGYPLVEVLSRALGMTTMIENDARMYTLGELAYGSGRGHTNLVCLTLGTGIGSGVVMGRRVLRGTRNVAGILGGHLTVQVEGPPCSCGNTGCLEALIGTQALQQLWYDLRSTACSTPQPEALPTPQQIFEAAAVGESRATGVVARFSQCLGAGIVNMIHAYDPDIVVLGGGLMHAAEQFLAQVQTYVDAHAWTIPRGRVRLVPAALGDGAALVGIAALARSPELLL
jgi:glucokinase